MAAAQKLRAWREDKGLTREKAAKLLGFAPANLSYYEDGGLPNVCRAIHIAKVTAGAVPVESWRPRKKAKKAA